MHFSSMRSIYLWSLMVMPCIVFKISSGQKKDGLTDGPVDYYMPAFGGIKQHISSFVCPHMSCDCWLLAQGAPPMLRPSSVVCLRESYGRRSRGSVADCRVARCLREFWQILVARSRFHCHSNPRTTFSCLPCRCRRKYIRIKFLL